MSIDSKNLSDCKTIIFWEGFPVCGLLIKKVADLLGDNLTIIATKPAVPFTDLENKLGHKIVWLENANDIWYRKDEFGHKDLIIHTGWVHKGWLKYDAYMKNKYNSKVIIQVDNRYRGDIRQWIGSLYFKLYLKKYFDGALVPGKEGRKLMQFLGLQKNKIYTGLYGAYEEIYKETVPIEKRHDEFLFVGQLITRKSVDLLIEAFKEYRKSGGKWNLRLVGSGPLETICIGDGIILENFAQPDKIVEKMNQAKVFVLPSKDDNWGTVLCEAAACGMNIITTKNVGASSDIVKESINGIILNKINSKILQEAFHYFERMPEPELKRGSFESKNIANNYTSEHYFNSFLKIHNDLIA